jgi:predicted nucleotidyltransferase/DNA-binding XRE family transcriptional regulator
MAMETNAVARIRQRAGLTQNELAELSGVAQPNIAAYEKGTRSPSVKMLERLTSAARPKPSTVLYEHLVEVKKIAADHQAVALKVFGSVARGQDRPGSDVDLLITFGPDATLYDQIELAQKVEDLLGVGVDVVSEGGLCERHAAILAEAKAL